MKKIERENWGPPPQHWIDFAVNNAQFENGGILTKMLGKNRFPEFEERAREALRSHGHPAKSMNLWINTHVPKEGIGYEDCYPHTHKNNDALVLVHYLLPGDKPAPLHILDGDKVVEEIYPEAGLTLYIPDGVSHGAMKNNGTTNRVCFVVMGHR